MGKRDPELLRTFEDRDFGMVEVWRTHFQAKPKGHLFASWFVATDMRARVRAADGRLLKVDLEVDGDDAATLNETVRQTFRAIVADEPRLRARIAAHTRDLLDDWTAEGGPSDVTTDDYARALTLQSIEVNEYQGACTIGVWYVDEQDEMFGDHALHVTLDDTGAITDAGLHG